MTTTLQNLPAYIRRGITAGFAGTLMALANPLHAATAVPEVIDRAFVQQLIDRMDKQDAELARLKARPIPGLAPEPTAPAHDSFPQVSFHGFGDITYRASDAPGDKNSFVLGQLDFFATSRLAENIGVLSETVIEASGEDNKFGIEVERLLLQLRPSDYFNIDIGRYHTAVGYYNTAYHHGAWFQTAVGRPNMLDFEDGGGIIPAHNVGFSANGEIPSGRAGLRYIFEVGNGRAYQPAGTDQNLVLNVQDDNSYKAVNLVVLSKPDAWPGLELGAGVYHDRITSITGVGRIDETMLHGHAVYKNSNWEFLSEGYLIRHAIHDGATHWTPAGFAQIAHKFGDLTPYARLSYLNAMESDPIYTFIGVEGVHYGPAVGLRYDFASLAAFKIQYDHMITSHARSANQLTLQAAFTF